MQVEILKQVFKNNTRQTNKGGAVAKIVLQRTHLDKIYIAENQFPRKSLRNEHFFFFEFAMLYLTTDVQKP